MHDCVAAMSCSWDLTSRYLAVGGSFECVVWDFETQSQAAIFKRKSASCFNVRFSSSPSVPLLVIGETGGNAHFVDTRRWEEQIVTFTGEFCGVTFSDDSRTIYIGKSNVLLLLVDSISRNDRCDS